MSHRSLRMAALVGFLCGIGTGAFAAGSATNGKALAEQRCANCHIIGRNMTNASESQPIGPDFTAMKKIDGVSLKTRLKTSHPIMSKFPDLNDQQAADLAAYIGSVAGK